MMRPVQYVRETPGELLRAVYTARLGDLRDGDTVLALSSIEFQERATKRHKWVTTRAWYRSEDAARFARRNYNVKIEDVRPVVRQEVWDALWSQFIASFRWRDGGGIIRKGDGV